MNCICVGVTRMRVRLLILLGVVLVASACDRGNSTADIECAKSIGQPIIRRLNDYKNEHGRYPASLQEAGIAPAATRLGTFEYERRGEGSAEYFVLLVGDHRRNGFVLFWNSAMASEGWLTEE